jgi:hypothetical protein
LIFAIAATGILMRYFFRVDIVSIKQSCDFFTRNFR